MPDLEKLFDTAIELSDSGEKDKAVEIYLDILKHREDWSAVHYNLGLYHKYQNNWEQSFKYNRRAVELEPDQESSQWNLGIAATMLEEWRIARKCWNYFGMKYKEINEDPAGNIGKAPIRINPNSEAEVVWAKRIDPARAIIENIPFPESEHRFGDMILNDGAPMGTRISNGKEYSVLNELQLLHSSDYLTYSIECNFRVPENYDLLEKRCVDNKIEIENWTSDVQFLCRQCSEGTPHEEHDETPDYRDKEMTIAFACQSEDSITEIVNSWSREVKVEFKEFSKY